MYYVSYLHVVFTVHAVQKIHLKIFARKYYLWIICLNERDGINNPEIIICAYHTLCNKHHKHIFSWILEP